MVDNSIVVTVPSLTVDNLSKDQTTEKVIYNKPTHCETQPSQEMNHPSVPPQTTYNINSTSTLKQP